jgi:hypothetical protein
MSSSRYYDSPSAMIPSRDVLKRVRPWVEYGMREGRVTGMRHAMTEVAAITYLMGMGYDQYTAHRIVESWEVDERFPC